MAVLSVTELSPLWTLDKTATQVTGTSVWQVAFDAPAALADALGAVDPVTGVTVPTVGVTFPGSTGVPCVKESPKYLEGSSKMYVIVTCDHDSTRTYTSNPLLEPAKISSSGEQSEETYSKDETTPTPKYAIHTNGLPFDELPRRAVADDVYEIEKNVAHTTTNATVRAMRNRVNDTALTIDGSLCAIGTVWCSAVSLSSIEVRNGYQFKVLRATLRYREAGWDQKFESRGVVDKNGKSIAYSSGPTVDAPHPLDSAGLKTASFETPGHEIVLKPYKAATLTSLV